MSTITDNVNPGLINKPWTLVDELWVAFSIINGKECDVCICDLIHIGYSWDLAKEQYIRIYNDYMLENVGNNRTLISGHK